MSDREEKLFEADFQVEQPSPSLQTNADSPALKQGSRAELGSRLLRLVPALLPGFELASNWCPCVSCDLSGQPAPWAALLLDK